MVYSHALFVCFLCAISVKALPFPLSYCIANELLLVSRALLIRHSKLYAIKAGMLTADKIFQPWITVYCY